MKYVLDVNVALKWVLNEVDSTKARRLRDNCGSRSTICYIAPVEQLGVLATLSRWRPRVQIPSGRWKRKGKQIVIKSSSSLKRVGWALASPGGRNPPAPSFAGSTPARRTYDVLRSLGSRPGRLSVQDATLSQW